MRGSRAFPAAALALVFVLAGGAVPPVPAAEGASAEPVVAAKSAATVDVNRATVEELVAVPGIGEALARRIVDFRSKNGPFQRVDDLLKIRGIGEKSLEKLRPHLRVGTGR